MEEEVLAKKGLDRRLFGRLISFAKPFWLYIVTALALMLLTSALQVVGPLLTKHAVDTYLAPVPGRQAHFLDEWLSPDPMAGLAQVSVLFLVAMLIGLATSFAQSYLMQRTGQYTMFALRRQLMAHLHTLDMAYFDRQPVGRIVTRVTSDIDHLNEFFTSGMVPMLADVVVVVFLAAAMIRLSPGMTLVMAGVAPLIAVATVLFRRAALNSNRRVRIAVARINAFLQEHITGMAVVQLFNREGASARQFDDANTEHMRAYKVAIHAHGWFYPVVEFVAMLAVAGILSYGGWQIQNGQLTIGALIAFFQYGIRFFRPIQDLSEKYNVVQGAMAASERVFEMLDTKAEVEAAGRGSKLPADSPASIEFEHVWFAYKDENWVLRDVSFRIAPGETIAVVGHTGAGKTTLTNLLLRFYRIQRGVIRVGGVDIQQIDPAELRRRFSIVLQDPFLFTGDLARNIRLGDDRIGDDAMKQAVERVNLADYVNGLPEGFSTEVRERGAGLSTGQKQLVSFARALAHDPQFLILDEATSSVDTETEFRIRDALNKLLTGRTSIVIAHRLSTVQRADRILVMHKGEVRESGTHQELLAQRGLYWKLYRLQYKDQERNAVPAAAPEPAAT